MSIRSQQVIFILSLALIYLPDGSLFLLSPAILISTTLIVISAGTILADVYFVLLLISSVVVVAFNPFLEFKEVARLLFSVGTVFGLRYLRISSEQAFRPLVLFLAFELVLRISGGDFSEITLYSIKGGAGLFSDSNFVGLLLVFCIAGLIDQENKGQQRGKIVLLSLFLLATFSRTAWLMMLAYLVSRKSRALGVLMVACSALIPIYFLIKGIEAENFDGSLVTKIYIFQTFEFLWRSDPYALLWGLGRELPGKIAENVSGTNYQGHTIYGQIVQYGLVLNLIFYAMAYHLSKFMGDKSFPYILSILFGAFLGLSPTSYFGMTLLLYGIFNRPTRPAPSQRFQIRAA